MRKYKARDATHQLYYLHVAMMTFTRQNVHQPLKKRSMRGGKSDAGGPEKQLILFVWPKLITLQH